MTLTIASITAGGADEVWVGFEFAEGDKVCRERFLISVEAYTQMGIRKGPCGRELYDRVEEESGIYAAFKRGLYILGYGACSERMLTSKLIAKGFSRETAEEAARRINGAGYMDEELSARREAERCAEKLWGESRIRAALKQKRYSDEAIDDAMFALEDGGIDFAEQCKRVIDQKYKEIPTDRAEMQKLVAAVCRLGYSVSQIKSACVAVQSERKRNALYRG